MKTFRSQCSELRESIKNKLVELIEKYGTKSDYVVNASCLKIEVDDCVEIVVDDDDCIFLVESDGGHLGLDFMGLETLASLTDSLIPKVLIKQFVELRNTTKSNRLSAYQNRRR